jgi:predicted PurR-regulated permease PerM
MASDAERRRVAAESGAHPASEHGGHVGGEHVARRAEQSAHAVAAEGQHGGRVFPLIPRRSHQVVFAAGCVLVALAVVYLLREVIGAFVLGSLLAFLLSPAVSLLERFHVPRALSVLAGLLLVLAAMVGLISVFVPLLTGELNLLRLQAPGLADSAQSQINRLQGHPVNVLGFDVDVGMATDALERRGQELVLGQFGNALAIGIAALGTALQLVLMLIVAFLVALDTGRIMRFARRLVPVAYRSDFDVIVGKLRHMLFAYIRGQLVVASLIGITSGVVVALLGLDFAIALGLLAGVTSLVPYVGPVLGAVPAVLVALAKGPVYALIVAVAYIVISNIILNFVYPKVIGDAVQLPPILIIVAFLAGYGLAGILGMFVAVPVAAALRILFEHVYPRLYGSTA